MKKYIVECCRMEKIEQMVYTGINEGRNVFLKKDKTDKKGAG